MGFREGIISFGDYVRGYTVTREYHQVHLRDGSVGPVFPVDLYSGLDGKII